MVPPATQAWDCFIAYPGGQRSLAEELAKMLSGRVRVFFDRRSLQPGDNWAKAIVSALESTYVTLVIVSPETDRAYYEQEEIQRALARARGSNPNRRVVPIFVGGTTAEDADIPYGLRLKQGFTIGSSQEMLAAADAIAGLVEEIRGRVALEEDGEEPRELSVPIRDHLATLKIAVERLTHDQYRVINQLRYMRRVRISGSAGSGKTLVGVEKAIRIARAGARVLFLCHNPLLSEHVQRLTAGTGVHVRDFAEWVNDLAGVMSGSTSSEWTHYDEPGEATLSRAFEALALDAHRYDAIIVDEGQDFREEWWTLVEAALTDAQRGSLYLFHDNNQSLLAHRSSYPVSEPHVDMSRNCRNAGRVLDLMRCFDSSAPEAEVELRSHGRVHFWRSESGGDAATLAEVLAFVDAERLLAQTVVLTTIESTLVDSPLAGLNVELGTARGWQEEVRKQFGRVLKFYDPSGVKAPKGGESWVEQELLDLSEEPYPTAKDIQLVTRLAAAFSISRAVRSRIMNNPLFRNGFAWRLSALRPHLRRPSTAPVWGAEILLHFARPEWVHGLPKPKTVGIRPFHLGTGPGILPLYRVSDFKGLEAEVVVLMMRGRLPNQREATYVGISRARALLFIVADAAAASTLPRAFVWD